MKIGERMSLINRTSTYVYSSCCKLSEAEREARIKARMAELRIERCDAEITREANRRLDEEKEREEAGQKAIDALVAKAKAGDKTAQIQGLVLGLLDPYEHLGMQRPKPSSSVGAT